MLAQQARSGGGALSERTIGDRTALAKMVRDLEDEALVASWPGTDDGRRRPVAITEQGIETVRDSEPLVAEAEARALRPLRARERQQVLDLLARALPPPPRGLIDLLQPRSISSIR